MNTSKHTNILFRFQYTSTIKNYDEYIILKNNSPKTNKMNP